MDLGIAKNVKSTICFVFLLYLQNERSEDRGPLKILGQSPQYFGVPILDYLDNIYAKGCLTNQSKDLVVGGGGVKGEIYMALYLIL